MEQAIPEDQRQIIEGVVHEGAALLSKSGPPDWGQRLSRYEGDIHVADVGKCPLAIIFGRYTEGLRILGLEYPGDSIKNGFCYPAGLTRPYDFDYTAWMNAVYATMADTWLREAAESLTPDR